MTLVWLAPLAGALALGLVVWGVSIVVRDASIVDIFWGPLFIVMAGVDAVLGQGLAARKVLVLVLVTAWGLRLAIHLARRNLGHGEDYRYRAMRERHGSRFWLVSLFTVFVLQGVLAWIIALPVHAALVPGVSAPLGVVDALGAAVFLVGLVVETMADLELTRFRRDPRNRDRVLAEGLFRYSRHPNYFGDALVWWGLGLVGVAAGATFSLVGPALMTLLLLRVSGVTLLEQTIEERRPAYAEYKRTTSAFFPWPPLTEKVHDGR